MGVIVKLHQDRNNVDILLIYVLCNTLSFLPKKKNSHVVMRLLGTHSV